MPEHVSKIENALPITCLQWLPSQMTAGLSINLTVL